MNRKLFIRELQMLYKEMNVAEAEMLPCAVHCHGTNQPENTRLRDTRLGRKEHYVGAGQHRKTQRARA
eukprot:6210732-Pleurochrysis_carterae.AAC.1